MMLAFTTSCSMENLAEDLLDNECDSIDLFGEAAIALGFYEKALKAYAEDQSSESCQELKAMGIEYINVIDAYRSCVPDGNVEIDSELDKAKAALADLDC